MIEIYAVQLISLFVVVGLVKRHWIWRQRSRCHVITVYMYAVETVGWREREQLIMRELFFIFFIFVVAVVRSWNVFVVE